VEAVFLNPFALSGLLQLVIEGIDDIKDVGIKDLKLVAWTRKSITNN
jgi:hypothetical protein